MRKKYTILLSITLFILLLNGCNKDDEFTESIFVAQEELDTDSPTYKFDLWLNENFLEPYNLSFQYKMVDVGSELDYNLVPSSIEESKQLAQLVKYLWFDVYAKMVNEEFLKNYGPRMIHLIGSPAYNPNSGTMLLGTAEGGIKITLFNCNNLNYKDTEMMNELFFKTMHHEFSHILHQTKNYPKEFETISAGNYSPLGWQNLTAEEAAQKGFVSTYSSSQVREDFVETIANYYVKSDDDWNALLDMAGSDGSAIILEKLAICKTWMKEKWGIDMLKMRNEIFIREQNINAEFFNKDL